jgi:hypothetical protein
MIAKLIPLIVGWLLLVGPAGLAQAAEAAHAPAGPRDSLVYKDGDRVQGKLVERAGGEIVFQSDRFGVLRVPAADAVVILADQSAKAPGRAKPAARPAPAPAVAQAAPPEEKPSTERAEEEKISVWERFSPWVLTAKVRNYFGPWHGRLAFSTETVSDSAHRNNDSIDAHLQRKWERDDVQLTARYDYAETNQFTTTDTVKSSAVWRHEFSKREFTQYRPSVEWNRASKLKGVPNDYVLLQQEIGVGFNLLTKPGRKVRAGVSENLFDVWTLVPTTRHNSRTVASTFEESDWTLPWRMTLSQRGVYYPVPNKTDGWESRIELNKKLTETLSVSLRQEMRRHNPDGSSQDYSKLKLLFGFDF